MMSKEALGANRFLIGYRRFDKTWVRTTSSSTTLSDP
jgi:hypothetical protein